MTKMMLLLMVDEEVGKERMMIILERNYAASNTIFLR